MDIKEAIKERHSVRQYKDLPIPDEVKEKLAALIDACNEESGLSIQLITDDPGCFKTFLAHYGWFKNAQHYFALVGKKDLPDLEEKCGYFGEKLVLASQMLGLRTCWVAGTYNKGKCTAKIGDDEKLVCVILTGYGETDGAKHRSKPVGRLCDIAEEEMPVWFKNGVKAAMMAPTAMNQQKFKITLDGDEAVISAGNGPMTKIDLGIVKYHFEAASGHKCR